MNDHDLSLLGQESPVIRQHLFPNMKDDFDQMIRSLPGISQPGIEAFLLLLKGSEDIPDEHLKELLFLSRHFECVHLEQKLIQYLMKNLDSDDVLIETINTPFERQAAFIPEYIEEAEKFALDPQRFNRLLLHPRFPSIHISKLYRIFTKIEQQNHLCELSHDTLYDFINQDLNERFILFKFLDMTKLSKEKFNQFITQVQETVKDTELFSFLPFPIELLTKYYHSACENETIVADQQNEIDQYKQRIHELEELHAPNKAASDKFVQHIFDLYKIPNENGNLIVTNTFRIPKKDDFEKDWKELFNIFFVESKYGNMTSTNNLGFCYYYGEGVEKNLEEAVRLFKLASDGGNLSATNNLGVCYKKGEGVEKNLEEAVRLFKLASDGGHLYATNNLGVCYEKGEGVEKNLEEAVRLFKLASDGGDLDATYRLAYCYMNGEGVAKNLEEAVRLFKLASDGGIVNATSILSDLLQTE